MTSVGSDLIKLVDDAARGLDSPLLVFLNSNSHLPGPRANLDLLRTFAVSFGEVSKKGLGSLWSLSFRLRSSDDEFVAMCGVRAIGVLGAKDQPSRARALSELRTAATDSRWRVRESVAMAIQDIIEASPSAMKALGEWVRTGGWLEMRAVAAGVAETRLLKDPGAARSALLLHKAIIDRVLDSVAPRPTEFRVLRQGLGYSLSVVVAAAPKDGFAFLRELVKHRDPDISWICRENLKKSRLASRFPAEVKAFRGTATH